MQIQVEPVQEVLPDTLSFRLQVADPNGLLQMQLNTVKEVELGHEIVRCRSLKGESATVELTTTGITIFREKAAIFQFRDAAGNSSIKEISVPEVMLPGPKIEEAWLWTIVPTGAKGGKQAYLEWDASVSSVIIGLPELKAIASYDT